MYSVKKVTDDLFWVGVNDRRIAMFEGVYSVPRGVSYNSYLLADEKTALFDTVDKAVHQRFLENIEHVLCGRQLDYLVIQHMEPDHSSAIKDLKCLYPDLKIVCNAKTLAVVKQFCDFGGEPDVVLVDEGETLNTGRHELHFVMAPMVHWPEVMVTYDAADRTLFSADAFGCFGALNGALFADEVDFNREYMDEARRYYTNIVGKYGNQVQALLAKASGLAIERVCPLHGFVWRKGLGDIIAKYDLWSRYEPEDRGVMIAYASVYGNTENAAEILSGMLRDMGIRTVMFDVSVTPHSEVVAAAFRWSHLVFASTTYNAGIFIAMEDMLNDLAAHNIQNRSVTIIENGSWAPTSGGLMREKLQKCRGIRFMDETLSIRSSVKPLQIGDIESMAEAIAMSVRASISEASGFDAAGAVPCRVDRAALNDISYGLYVLTAREGEKDNGCIINTVCQVTETPSRVSITVNNANYTHDMIKRTGVFNLSVLAESVPFKTFEGFGFRSGKDCDKFADGRFGAKRADNGVMYLKEHVNAVISGSVAESREFETHTTFVAEITEAFVVSREASVTYRYYHENVKPKPTAAKDKKTGYVCKVCGFEYEGESLPEGFVCPLCKHGAEYFEKIK